MAYFTLYYQYRCRSCDTLLFTCKEIDHRNEKYIFVHQKNTPVFTGDYGIASCLECTDTLGGIMYRKDHTIIVRFARHHLIVVPVKLIIERSDDEIKPQIEIQTKRFEKCERIHIILSENS